MPEQIISQEGYDKLQEELRFLSTIKRKEIAERIEKAKELGDLSENAEYSEAKDAQALNDGRILDITNTLKNVVVVTPNARGLGKIDMSSVVTVDSPSGKKEYTIVSFNEANPAEGLISNESPIGMAFLGKGKGEAVIVETPRGPVKYKILEVK